MAAIQKLSTNLWFDKQAEEAAKYYCSIFKNSKMGRISRYGKAGFEQHRMPEGTVMTVEFELEGQHFVALNAGPIFQFNEAVSFVINCENQQEVDFYWNKLGEGGDPRSQVCGWLKDKYGLSWQVVPNILTDLMHDKNEGVRERVMEAMMKMKKLEIAPLLKAAEGTAVNAN